MCKKLKLAKIFLENWQSVPTDFLADYLLQFLTGVASTAPCWPFKINCCVP